MSEQRGDHRDVSFLVLSGSMRAGSLDTKLAGLAASTVEANGGHVDFATMAACAKKRWVEFLGEPPHPATDRVE